MQSTLTKLLFHVKVVVSKMEQPLNMVLYRISNYKNWKTKNDKNRYKQKPSRFKW